MLEVERTVEITQTEYERLVQADVICDLLIDALYADAKLNWRKDSLIFEGDSMNTIVPLVTESRYKRTFERLLMEREEEERKAQEDTNE